MDAPSMILSGHSGEVYTMKFAPDGTVCASGSHDKSIFLWRVSSNCENYMVLRGHLNAVVELHWTQDGDRLISCSPDGSIRSWDTQTGKQLNKMEEHGSFVNTCCPLRRGPPLFVSGADDGCIKLWDLREKKSAKTLWDIHPVTTVSFPAVADVIYSGGIDNDIKQWDLRKGNTTLTLSGHTDTITSLRVSPAGTQLLSYSMDNTLKIWDMRTYAKKDRCMKTLTGHPHSSEKNLLKCDWSPDGRCVSAGGGDHMVYIWDVATESILFKLPGHSGSVNEAAFHPTAPIIGSCSSDKRIYLGEVDY